MNPSAAVQGVDDVIAVCYEEQINRRLQQSARAAIKAEKPPNIPENSHEIMRKWKNDKKMSQLGKKATTLKKYKEKNPNITRTNL